MPNPERRFASGNVTVEKRADGQSQIVGYGAVYYNGSPGTEYKLWEGAVERILPGAFDRAMKDDDVRGLFNHDPSHVLGRTKAGTMRLSVDKTGLRYEIDPPDTQTGRDVATVIGRQDVTGSSFSFLVTDQRWATENGIEVREIRGVQLFDVGPVTFPAYEATTTGLRAAGDSTEARASREAWHKARGSLAATLAGARARAVEVSQ